MGKPTDKMIEFAEKLAKDNGVEFPESCKEDFDECSSFIDDNKKSIPTNKQVELAENISKTLGVEMPKEQTFETVSEFITNNIEDYKKCSLSPKQLEVIKNNADEDIIKKAEGTKEERLEAKEWLENFFASKN